MENFYGVKTISNVDNENVNVSMAKVMGASANNEEKDTTGGKIMGEPTMKAKKVSGEASKVGYSYSGPGYKGDK